jgi:hypothetical protein
MRKAMSFGGIRGEDIGDGEMSGDFDWNGDKLLE